MNRLTTYVTIGKYEIYEQSDDIDEFRKNIAFYSSRQSRTVTLIVGLDLLAIL